MKYKKYVKGLSKTKVMAVCTKNYSKMRSVPKLLSQAVSSLQESCTRRKQEVEKSNIVQPEFSKKRAKLSKFDLIL